MKIEISELTNQDKVERKMPKVKFSNFSNMKIAITPEQPLDEVARELKRLGYKKHRWSRSKSVCVWAYQDGDFIIWDKDMSEDQTPTTLTELKEMK